MLKKINVLSLFDGISCGMVALERAGISVNKYYASEIDKYAIQISKKNYPDIIQVGDITKLKGKDFKDIDLIMGGSPCTSLSIAKRQKESGLEKGESKLFWEFVRLLKEVKPKYFLLENVASMKIADKDKITEILGVEPITINSSLVSAQMRKRHYWTNIKNIEQPKDKGIFLKDILEYGYTEKDKSYCLTATYSRACIKDCIGYSQRQMVFNKPIKVAICGNSDSQGNRVYSIDGKSVSLVAKGGGKGAKTGLYEVLKNYARKLTSTEAERLQTLPDGYTEGISENKRLEVLGNGWTVDVVAHILKQIKKPH
jgi:DNA (cytosine-5)-methyltransferase 3A